MTESAPLLTIRDLSVSFASRDADPVRAVAGLSLTIHHGQTLAVVGESGCGKSVTALSILRLLPTPPARIESGAIEFQFDGDRQDLLRLPPDRMRAVRGGEIAMIFQEPMTSLNPVFSIGEQLVEAIRLHAECSRAEARERAGRTLEEVGISDPASRLRAYPHEFSGGMRQRVMIAMALACQPRLLIADEPTTALDVTIQAQLLDLLNDIRRRRNMSIMLITHDLGVVARNADVVCVMYDGRVVEYASTAEIFSNPLHPYTRGLFSSIPRMAGAADRLRTVAEIVNDPAQFRDLDLASGQARPWWPESSPGSSRPGGGHVLAEAAEGHWVRVWRSEAIAGLLEPTPSIPRGSFRAQSADLSPVHDA
ncbi:MAG: ABC transporter ATP-binding protein [Planctomycetota bacterium]|nr:ABC transporter ATP-binding protein [Planctomycetota bacterium]